MTVTKFILNEILLLLVIFNALNVGYAIGIHFLFLNEPQ
jgi:hypothetical protein